MPRNRISLTDTFVRSQTVETRTDFWDAKVRGLVLRVTPTGVKTWTVIYSRESDGARQRVTLGRYPAISLETARKKALKAMSAIAEGDDPADRKRATRASMTVEELGDLFIDKYAKRNKRTWAEDERLLKVDVYPSIGKMKATAVKRRDILDIIDAKADVGKGAASTNVLAVVRKMFGWAVDQDYLPASPVTGVKPRAKPTRRDRVLSDREIGQIWVAINNAGMINEVKDILRLLLILGQRSGEVAGMRKPEVDLSTSTWVIPGARTKNGQQHVVPLPDLAIAIIEPRVLAADEDAALFSRNTGDPIESNAIAQAVRLKLQGLKDLNQGWTPHDLRRTAATGMATLGTPPHIVEAVLNHISGFRAGVSGIYNRALYEPEKRAALDNWASKLSALIKISVGSTPQK